MLLMRLKLKCWRNTLNTFRVEILNNIRKVRNYGYKIRDQLLKPILVL